MKLSLWQWENENMEIASCRGKQSEIWDPGVVATLWLQHVYGVPLTLSGLRSCWVYLLQWRLHYDFVS